MTYATQQALIDRFGQVEITQLSDRTGSGSIDPAVVTAALNDADAEINGYLATKYTLPLAPVPLVLVRLAGDIARYYLYEDRVTEAVRTRYEDAVKFLKNVASGVVTLGVDAANQAPAASGGPQFEAPDRQFTHDTLEDF